MGLRANMTFETGKEWGPGSPWGASRLTVQPDGRFSFENRSGGHLRRTRTGWIETAAVEQLAKDLKDARFPSVPRHFMVPDGGFAIIAKGKTAEQRVFMCDKKAVHFRGYGPLLQRIRAWERFLNGDARAALPSELHLDP